MLNQKASVLDRGTRPLLLEEGDSGWSDVIARGGRLGPVAGAWVPPVLNQFWILPNADQPVGGPDLLSRSIAGKAATALLSRGGFGGTLGLGIRPFQSRLAALLSSSASLVARPNAGSPAFSSILPGPEVAQASSISSAGATHWINSSDDSGPSALEGLWTPLRAEPVSESEHQPNTAAGMAGQPASNSRLVDLSAHGGSAVNSMPTSSLSVMTDRADYAPGSTATFTAAGIRSGASVTFNIADLLSAPGANGISDVYTPFTIKDGGIGDVDGLANGTVVAQWQVPADGRATGATLQLSATSGAQTGTATFSDAGNKIVTENQLPGTPKSTWAIHGSIANAGDSQIEGFATQISTNAGQTVSFKIDTASSVTGYTLDIYRLGYYGGNGARLISSMHHTGTDNQPNPIFNSATNTVDAGNWSVTDSWAVPSTAVSGVYFAKLTSDTGNFQNMVPFIVRNDGTTSDILLQTSDTTWEAYNSWGGYNLYQGPSGTTSDRAYEVSYNRPIAMNVNSNEAQPTDFVFGEEYAAIYWLEQNGYNLNYISGIDASTNAGLLQNTKAYIDVGHDEYWSQSQFNNVKAAADAGIDLAFLSGNQIYWDTQLAPSFDASHTANRNIIEYKDIWSGTQLDPNGTANGGAGLFRDPVYGPGTPENSLSGTIFTVDDSGTLSNITIPASMSQLRFWRNTNIASGNGGTLTNLLGYEWDSDLDNGFRPGGLIDMSSTTKNVNTLLLDNGLTTGPGTATHSLTLYRDPTSGALVFGAGTVMWSWGLSNQYVPFHGITAPVSTAVQQSMVNLFADMGVMPQTLQTGLVAAQISTDHTAPVAVVSSPAGGTSFSQGQAVTITGTASDAGGRVAGIEVSTDGGTTWHPASGTTSWSYTWTASGVGTHLIEARATDDSINLQATPATVNINVTGGGSGGGSLFTASNVPAQTNLNDGRALEVGVKFTSSAAGQITALKFYRSPSDTGSDLLDLWTANGTKLASATFTNATASGWQTVSLATAVTISANTTYIASYHTNGAYVATSNFFSSAFTSGSLVAPSSTSSGGNGVYSYGGTSTAGIFPTSTFASSNYWADVVFTPSNSNNTPPTAIADTADGTEKGGVNNSTGGSPATGNVLTNDTDPDVGDTKTVTAVSFGSTSGTLGSALNGAHGSLVLNAAGAFTYTVNETDPAVQALRLATNTLTDVFSYTMRDAAGATSSTTLTITVHGANDAPVLAIQTGNQTATVGSAFSLTLPAGTFTDVDSGDSLAYTATTAADATLPAWLTFNASTRTFSGTPTSTDVGTVSVKATATDLGSLAASETFNIAVTTTPNTPPTAVADTGDATEKGGVNNSTGGSSATGNVLTNDTDPDAGDTKTVTAVSFGSTSGTLGSTLNGAHGSLVLNATGAFTYTVNEADPAVQSLRLATNTLTDVFSYTMRDAAGATSSTTLTITVHGANDAPVLAIQTGNQTATVGSAFSLALPAGTFTDVDSGDSLAYTATAANGSALPSWLSFNAAARTFSGTPASGDVATVSVKATATDLGSLAASETFNVAVSTAPSTVSLFSSSDTPSVLSDSDTSQVNLGVRFTSSAAGTITAIKYYKSVNDAGTHTGSLWTSTGTLLASATFSNETGSGWQTVTFSSPVSITAGTTYVASFHSNGHYADTPNYFTTADTNGPLTAPASNNGVYTYGTGNLFPTSTFNATNYWVDVVFSNSSGGTNQPPIANNDSGFNATENVPLSIPGSALLANDTDPNGDALTITGVSGAVNGTVGFSSQNNTVTFTPANGYTGPASFNYAISDGRGGTASANVGVTVHAPSASTVSLFSANPTPSAITVNDPNSVELGMKFQASTSGDITGLRFYKGPSNTGTHVADLWSSTGTLLATATFSNETASGWQQVNFATPVTITAGTTYIASYHTAGTYSADPNLFASSVTNGPLTAPSSASSGGNGVYAYGSGSLFPTNTFNATSYAVDVLFRPQLAA
ncbi:DUF4082 domain-containing protein [Bradyrhizobium sp. 166]|uniref:DUF4082 domain-containing protein n=1 Tax=Bradyrhizobium sp. 166 TaxID=2782638 RepID=UPI001FFB7CB4|nr:DUF4082 domain-containing protein [Bradyrhizobium sp. 166]MCK1607107.1 DUF4082 domain-containing protein [Bradyrhizobium sp. 166]